MAELFQYRILHLTDVHFGSRHILKPTNPGQGSAEFPRLAEILIPDIKNKGFSVDQREINILIISGDFTQVADATEFNQALEFLNDLIASGLFNKEKTFIVPGNHDVVYNESTAQKRFIQYSEFYNSFFDGIRKHILAKDALNFSQIRWLKEEKLIVMEVNCSHDVEKGTVNEKRGQVGALTTQKIEEIIKEMKIDNLNLFNECAKIAIFHHHPILMPGFIEPGRGNDSIEGVQYLLNIMSENNFHLITHGHKHYPQIYAHDVEFCWSLGDNRSPQIISAGGSLSSNELPSASVACNTYNDISMKWLPVSKEARIRITTHGLVRTDQTGTMLPHNWKWKELRTVDRFLSSRARMRDASSYISETNPQYPEDKKRIDEYIRLRGCLPVVEVLPSLAPEQAYEARVWLEYHDSQTPHEKPVMVTWTAGRHFPKIINEDGKNFCSSLHYWGAMLIQAKLTFQDNSEEIAFVYARMPSI